MFTKINKSNTTKISRRGGNTAQVLETFKAQGEGVFPLNEILEYLRENNFSSREVEKFQEKGCDESESLAFGLRAYLSKSHAFDDYEVSLGYSSDAGECVDSQRQVNVLVIEKKK